MTALTVHQPTGRPIVDNLPVPYITRWTGEVDDSPLAVVAGHHQGNATLAYSDDLVGIERDLNGLLWLRDKALPGGPSGTPMWQSVHGRRARACMHRRRCQVCGRKFPDDGPLTFVFNRAADDQIRDTDSPFITMFAPTCTTCAPWAAVMCPNLRRTGAQFCEANDVKPVGAWGDVCIDMQTWHPMRIMYGDPNTSMFLAKQPLLRIADYRVLPMPSLQRGT